MNVNTISVANAPNFVRDIASKAVLNTNKGAYEEILSKRALNSKIRSLEDKFSTMENSLNNITRMLQQLTDDSK